MDEEVINDLFNRAVAKGYKKSLDEFINLLHTDGEVFDDMYSYVQSKGYKKDTNEFSKLIGKTSTSQKPVTQQPMAEPAAKKKEEVGGYGQVKQPLRQTLKEEKPTVINQQEELNTLLESLSAPASSELPIKGLDKMYPARSSTRVEEIKSPLVLQQKQEAYAKKKEEEAKENLRVIKETNALKLQEQELQNKLQEEANLRSQTPEFISKLSTINNNLFDDYSNADAIKKEFEPYGIVIERTGFWKNKLVARSKNGDASVEIDLSVDSNEGKNNEIRKLRDFVSKGSRITEEEDFLNKAIRAKNLRKGFYENQPNVEFTTYGNNVIPTTFPKTLFPKTKEDWIKLSPEQAFEEAKKRGEIFSFKTEKEAQDFASGSWKDISKVDIEGDNFFRSKGRDYLSDMKKLDRYDELESMIDFVEGYKKTMPGEKSIGLATAKQEYPQLFVNGNKLRSDIDQVIQGYKKERDSLRPQVKDITFLNQDGTFEKTNMDFDTHLAKLENKAAQESTKLFREAKTDVDIVNAESIKKFNMPIESLIKEDINKVQDKEAYKNLVQQYANANQIAQTAALKFTEAKTYFDAKTNKEIVSELTDNWTAVSNSWNDGLKNGLIGDQLLALTIPGFVPISGATSTEDAAKYISEKLASMSGTQSRVMTRLGAAKTAYDWFDVILDDPLEGMLTAVAQSVSQMLPYGSKIIATSTAAGAGTGAIAGLAGGPLAPATVSGGAFFGATQGFRAGMAATGYATEYTNALMEAVRNQGYDPLDPKSLAEALNKKEVWNEGAAVGAARGIPIAAVDFLTAGLAGKMLGPTSKLATTSTKLGKAVAENAIIDPLAEGTGELIAQGSEMIFGTGRKEFDFNEIGLEALGSMGSNLPNYVINTYGSIKQNTDINLAYNLTEYKNLASERVSDERISNWANNMQRLGKIDEAVNQKIQENVGLRRDAKSLMSVGTGSVNNNVTARTMELLAAKKELTSSKERQEIYGDDIRAINEELAAMGKSKELLPTENQVDLSKISGIEQQGVGEYMINGRRYTKQQFLDKINSSTPERLSKSTIGVKNDDDVAQIINQKIDAIQEQTTDEVSLQPETEPGREMEAGGPEAGTEVITEESVLSPEESKRKKELEEEISILSEEDKKDPSLHIVADQRLIPYEEAQAELDALNKKEQGLTEKVAVTEEKSTKAQEEIEKRRQEEKDLLINNINIEENRRPNGSIGTQGFTPESILSLVRFINDKMNLNIPSNLMEGEKIRPLIEYIKNDSKLVELILNYVKSDPIEIEKLPDGTLHFKDGNHRANLLNLIGAEILPTIETNQKEQLNEINNKYDLELSNLQEVAPTEEVTPTTADVFAQAPDKETIIITSPEGTEITLQGNEQTAAKLYEEAVATPEAERTAEQNDIIQKLEPIVIQDEVARMEMMLGETKAEPTPTAEVTAEIPVLEEGKETDLEIVSKETTPEEQIAEAEQLQEEKLPEAEKPIAGKVTELAIDDIIADPQRFQYKETTDKEAGVTEKFKKEGMPFKKELAGVISVWVDPADGKTYVINGHHRLEFARRSGEKSMNVIYIDAANASEARVKGAMQNIAEGMGTDVDAAKIFRETGMTAQQARDAGIDVKGAKALNGLALAQLSDSLFDLVAQGKLSQTVGIIIGSTIKNKSVQEQFYNTIKNKNLNNATIKVMAEDIQSAPVETVEVMDLFGTTATEKASYEQRASFIASVRGLISKAKNILGKTAKSAEFLKEYGNEIDKAATETGSKESAVGLAVFDSLRNTSAEIKALIDKGVERIKNGENKTKVINETARAIIEATPRIVEGATGVTTRTETVPGRGETKKPSTKGGKGAKGEKLSDKVRGLKVKGPGGLQSNILGVPIAIWNAAMDTVAKAIDAGVAISDALSKGYAYIKEKHKAIDTKRYEAKILSNIYSNAIQLARENKISDKGIEAYLMKKGLTEEQAKALLKIKPKAEKKPISKEKIIGKPKPKKVTVNDMTALKDQISREIKAAKAGAKSVTDVVKAIVGYVNKMAERGNLTRKDLTKILNLIPKVKDQKSLDKTADAIYEIIKNATTDIIEVSDYKLMVNQIRFEAKAAREAKGDLNAKRKMLAAAINKMAESGVLSAKQAEVLAKRVSLVNLNNPDAVQKLIDYAGKLFKDADYGAKLREANKLRSNIKQLSENKEKLGNLTPFAAKFAEIDPSMLENIDEYIEMAKAVNEGVAGSKLTPKGVKPSDAVDVEAAMDYVEKALEEQQKEIEKRTAEKVESLLGIDAQDLTYDQMMALLEQPENEKIDDTKERIVRSFINKMFDTYSSIIKSMFDKGVDPFSDPDNPTEVKFTKEQKALVEEFMGMDLSKMSVRDALRAADALNNFIVNKSTANMGTVVAKYRAESNANKMAKSGIVSKALRFLFSKGLGKFNAEQIISLPLLFERMFKSPETGLKVMREMGFNSIANGAARATTTVSRTITAYLNEFSKSKPNGKAFNDAFNITERGIVAFMSRSIIGTDKQIQEEFNDRKALIEESIEELSEGTKEEQDKAKVYQEVYDKVLRDSKNSSEVKQKADKKNVEAVDWWVNEWSKHYDQLADVSLNIYNTVLDKDAYYTTDRLSKLSSEKDTDIDDESSAFHHNNGNISEKKAGALMKARDKKKGLPKDKDGKVTRYVNLSFDSVNASSLYDALTDINTAEGIKQVKAFQKSKAYKKIFPNADDRAVLDRRISLAVKNIRNQNQFDNSELDKMVRALDTIARFSASMALAGPTQIPKQTVSIAINTLVNAGKISLNYIGNIDKINFIKNSGRAIANRGVESQIHLESINKMMEEAAKSKPEVAMRLLKQANDLWLKIFLAKPDAYIAKASWLSYYEQSLKKQGKLPKQGIDYSSHEINEEAADYAQMMVDRQQNITDTRLAGALYSPEGGAPKKLLTRIFLPLASFRMNQFQRMASDLTNLTSRTASFQEKKNAFRSLAAFGAEQAVFKSMVIGFGLLFYLAADALRGDEPDEEEWEKRRNNLLKAQATGAVTDVFSPIPLTDPFAKYGFNTVLSLTQDLMDVVEEDKLSIFTEDMTSGSTYAKSLGMYGISIDKAMTIYDNIMLASTGEYKDKYGNIKIISEDDRNLLSQSIVPSIILNAGLLPGAPEYNNIMAKVVKKIQKDSKTPAAIKKEDLYGGYKTMEEFKRADPEGYEEASKEGGELYEYRKEQKEKRAENKEEKESDLEEKYGEKPLTDKQIEKLRKDNPREWREKYGPGTEYSSPEARRERAQKEREAAREKLIKEREERKEKLRQRQLERAERGY